MKTNVVYNASCESMRAVGDGTIALTLSSPPYWNAINYRSHAQDPTKNYRDRADCPEYADYSEFLAWLQRIFLGEVWRVTKPGGFCALVLATVLRERRHYNLPADISQRLVDGGWLFQEDITWHKVTAGTPRAGVAIQHPYPGNFYPNLMTERILIFTKRGDRIYAAKSATARSAGRFPVDELFKKEIANNVWHIPPVPPRHLNHPCPFPEEIPHRLIQLYSYPDDVILDPFCGSGQVPKVARALGRRYIAYDSEPKYAALARRRSHDPLDLRPRQIIPEWKQPPVRIKPPPTTKLSAGIGRREARRIAKQEIGG